MAKKKYYAVKKGKTPGVYLTWEDCKVQVDGFPGAEYKGFATEEEAFAYAGIEKPCTEDASEDIRESLSEDSGENERPSIEEGDAVAYVDGSYNVATGEYSCGVVFMTKDDEIHIAERGQSEELASMRNVAGEIMGAELAMKRAVEMGLKKLEIYHDYEGIAAWCLGRWKTNKEGTKAYQAYFDSIKDRIEIQFVKVKGHSGDAYNDLADELAKSVIF